MGRSTIVPWLWVLVACSQNPVGATQNSLPRVSSDDLGAIFRSVEALPDHMRVQMFGAIGAMSLGAYEQLLATGVRRTPYVLANHTVTDAPAQLNAEHSLVVELSAYFPTVAALNHYLHLDLLHLTEAQFEGYAGAPALGLVRYAPSLDFPVTDLSNRAELDECIDLEEYLANQYGFTEFQVAYAATRSAQQNGARVDVNDHAAPDLIQQIQKPFKRWAGQVWVESGDLWIVGGDGNVRRNSAYIPRCLHDLDAGKTSIPYQADSSKVDTSDCPKGQTRTSGQCVEFESY